MNTTSQSRRKEKGQVRAKRTPNTEHDTKPENGRQQAADDVLPTDSSPGRKLGAAPSESELNQYVSHLIRGASPAGACMQLGISVRSLLRKLAEDADFRRRVDDVQWVLRENVKSALYREAMGGNVSAQRCFLQLVGAGDMTPFRQGFDDENWESMTPHDMAEKYRTAGVVVPAELEALL